MSKFFSKTVKKTAVWSVLMAFIVVAGIAICAVFGFNKDLAMKDKKTLTVSLNAYVYTTQLDTVKEELGDKLGAEYILEGEMSGDVSEIVFVFGEDAKLSSLKTKAETYLSEKAASAEGWAGVKYNVSASVEAATTTLAKGYALRAVIACAVFAVLAFVYVAIRYKLASGIVAGVSVLLAMLTTASIIVLTRVYVTSSVAYAISMAGVLTAVMTLFTFNKIRSEQKAEDVSEAEFVASSVAKKEVLATAAIVGLGMVLAGILGKEGGVWFAVSALIAIVVSVFVSLFFAPAAYLSRKTAFDAKPVKDGYVGAKKTSKKEKKVYATKEVVVAPVEETVVEEAPVEEVEEAPVEETVAEEAPVEEVEEAPVEEVVAEEAPVEEVEEAPVEETVAEEAPAEEVEENTEA